MFLLVSAFREAIAFQVNQIDSLNGMVARLLLKLSSYEPFLTSLLTNMNLLYIWGLGQIIFFSDIG